MSSHVSLTTRDGGGRLASGAEHSTSQRPMIAPTASSGGSTFHAYRFAAASSRDGAATGGGAGLRASLAAATVAGTLSATTLASWVRGTDLKVALIRQLERLIARLAKYASGLAGSNTLPSKKVSTPRDVDCGISPAGTPISLAASRHRSSR